MTGTGVRGSDEGFFVAVAAGETDAFVAGGVTDSVSAGVVVTDTDWFSDASTERVVVYDVDSEGLVMVM